MELGAIPNNPRRWLAQAVLCGLLLACLALAAAIAQHRRASMHITLDPAKRFSATGLNLRVPHGWKEQSSDDAIVLERPAQGVEPARRLTIRHQRSRAMLSPLEALQRSGMLRDHWWALPRASTQLSSITIAGWQGMMVTLDGNTHGADEASIIRVASAVLPSRDIIQLRLETFGTPEPFDADVINGVAESVSIDRLLQPAPANGDFKLSNGLHLILPDHFLTLPRDDDWRTGLQLQTDATSPCIGLELVPCLFLDTDNADAFAMILSCRDPQRLIGPIEKFNERTWVCRTTSDSGLTLITDYLLTNHDGQALLAEFHADASPATHIDQLWSGIEPTVQFPAQSNIAARLDNGAQAVAHLHAVPPVFLGPSDDRYLYWDKRTTNVRRPIDLWIHPGEGAILGQSRMELPLFDNTITETTSTWRLANDLSSYEFEVSTKSHPGDAPLRQKTVLSDGNITTAVDGIGHAPVAQPAQFLPGSILPGVLAALHTDQLLLRTESCLIAGNSFGRGLITLLIDPCNDHPRTLAAPNESPTPMTAVRVSINGTGEITRWYFDPDAKLRLIELSEDLQIQREDATLELLN